MDSANASRLDAISTRWSLLAQACDGSAASAGEARSACAALSASHPPLCRAALQGNDADADDVTHDVVVRLLTGDFAGADPQRGHFRKLLKTAVMNMVRNHWAKTRRRRSVDFDVAEVAASSDADDEHWTNQWRESLLDLVWKALEQSQREQPGSVAFTLLQIRTTHPEYTSEQLAEELAKVTGKPVRADAVRQKLRRARLQFVDLLLVEVAQGLPDPSPGEIEEELASMGLIEFLRDLLPTDWKRG